MQLLHRRIRRLRATNAAKKDIKAEDRGKYGVIVRQNHSGDLDNHYGVVKPAEKAAAAKKKAVAKGEETAS